MSTYVPNIKDTAWPPTYVNSYVLSKLEEFGLVPATIGNMISPMVTAVVPTNIEDLYNDRIEITQDQSPLLIIFDRLTRFRSSAFYRNKKEQLIYYFYTSDPGKLLDAVRVVSDILDREDAAAQDLNSWCRKNMTDTNIFFHNMRVYQADESRDLVELASARTLFINKLIVEYDYHTVTPANYKYD